MKVNGDQKKIVLKKLRTDGRWIPVSEQSTEQTQ